MFDWKDWEIPRTEDESEVNAIKTGFSANEIIGGDFEGNYDVGEHDEAPEGKQEEQDDFIVAEQDSITGAFILPEWAQQIDLSKDRSRKIYFRDVVLPPAKNFINPNSPLFANDRLNKY